MSPFSIPIRRIIKNISCSLLLMAHFLPCHAADVESNKVMAGVLKALEGRDAKIESITAYAIPVDAERRFSYAVQKGRLHVFLRFTAGGHHGWTELNATRAIPTEKVPGFINSQLKWYGELKGLTVADALKAVVARRPKGVREMEVAEMALLDLAGRLAGKPTIELLGLTGKDPVPGVFCILSDDPAEVEKLAKLALEQKLSTHMKVIFNMHPACMGSVMETVTLGHLIQSWERKLMVGDSSLVGPACPAWTQMAIGLGADWVEAIEKPQENDVFQRCLLKNAVGRTPDGRFHIRESLPGWGIEIDEAKLRELAAAVVEL